MRSMNVIILLTADAFGFTLMRKMQHCGRVAKKKKKKKKEGLGILDLHFN